jgi:hypothetical protein
VLADTCTYCALATYYRLSLQLQIFTNPSLVFTFPSKCSHSRLPPNTHFCYDPSLTNHNSTNWQIISTQALSCDTNPSPAGTNMINHFSVLGIKPSAKEDDIKKAYRRLSNKYHPDKLLGASDDEKEQASQQLERVKKAYEVLSDPKLRNAFIRDFNNVIVTDPNGAMRELWDQFYP